MIPRRIAIIGLLLACSVTAGFAQERRLPRRLAPGRYVLSTACVRHQALTVNQVARPAFITGTTLLLGMRVRAAEPQANALVEIAFREIARTITNRGKTLAYNSTAADPQPSRLGRLLAPLLEAKIHASLTPAGRVAEVRGLDAIWDAQALKNKDSDMAKWVNQIKAEMGNEMIGDLLDQIGRVLPAGPVRVGQSWLGQMKFRLPYVGEKKRSQKVVFRKIETRGGGAVAVLDLGETITDRTVSTVQVQPMPLTIQRMEVAQTGQLRIGLASVSPVDLVLKRHSTLTMSGNHPTQGPVAVQLRHTWSTRLTLRRETDPAPKTE